MSRALGVSFADQLRDISWVITDKTRPDILEKIEKLTKETPWDSTSETVDTLTGILEDLFKEHDEEEERDDMEASERMKVESLIYVWSVLKFAFNRNREPNSARQERYSKFKKLFSKPSILAEVDASKWADYYNRIIPRVITKEMREADTRRSNLHAAISAIQEEVEAKAKADRDTAEAATRLSNLYAAISAIQEEAERYEAEEYERVRAANRRSNVNAAISAASSKPILFKHWV